MKMHIVEE